jgi:hypothetical protein
MRTIIFIMLGLMLLVYLIIKFVEELRLRHFRKNVSIGDQVLYFNGEEIEQGRILAEIWESKDLVHSCQQYHICPLYDGRRRVVRSNYEIYPMPGIKYRKHVNKK